MDAIRKILAPTDLSETSQAGVRYALELAALFGAEVHIYSAAHYEQATPYPFGLDEGAALHIPIMDTGTFLQERGHALTRFVTDNFGDLTTGLRVYQETDIGAPSDRILEKAAAIGANLIVMSTHGRTGLGHMLIGSITEQVVRRSCCPVLAIRP